MIEMSLDFFKKIYTEDILYHYTKASTAIDYILYNEELKFNSRQNSFDPTESRSSYRGTTFSLIKIDKAEEQKIAQQSNELEKQIIALEKEFNQICFCKNNIGEDFASENYFSQFSGNEELFGFTKPRMWERYADNHSGVCIAFSKHKILEANLKKYKLLFNDVQYLNFRELSCKKIGDISGNRLLKVGFDEYKREMKKNLETSFFCKHIDYIGENEFRIGTYYDKNKCSLDVIRGEITSDKSMMLDITGCIEAIFISSFANIKQKISLLEYADKLEVPIVELVWQHDSFQAKDIRKSNELINLVRSTNN
ncbi:DUF2971 domain-containing protein [uncultured Zobellia sp.]|uniref:DUF2971 domain-containing protein n=1 Tax=uncultured Zobellia sp. TaxID=255433 RepID=UPI0025972093|nr:DUF2971 domain-containing protein [uncultured Zobellia sp.]